MGRQSARSRAAPRRWREYEVEVVGGLEEFAEHELRSEIGEPAQVVRVAVEGRIAVRFRGDPRRFLNLRTVTAVHFVERFNVARPRALLGHQHLEVLLRMLKDVLSLHPSGAFATFRISAAGADSQVFTRLKEHIAGALGLTHSKRPANLQVVVRRPLDGSYGWEVLARLTPNPLTARAWRVRDYPGALNAAIASVMIRLAGPYPHRRFLNLCCGSGTLMIERLDSASATLVAGIDHSQFAIQCASDNLRSAGHYRKVHLLRGDVGAIPLPSASIDEIVADLPYGMLVDAKGEIERVHTAALNEATRLAAPHASFIAVTVRKKLFGTVLGRFLKEWDCLRTFAVRVPFQSGYVTSTIYSLRRRS